MFSAIINTATFTSPQRRVGKTSLIVQYIQKYFDDIYKSTIGVSFWSKEIRISGQTVALKIFDTAGQEKFSCALPGSFYRKSHCCILVYDVTDPKSFVSLQKWKSEFLSHSGARDPQKVPLVLIGNKADESNTRRVSLNVIYIQSHSTCQFQVPESDAKRWCLMNNNAAYFETSAKESTNVEKAFLTAAKLALKYLKEQPNSNTLQGSTININSSLGTSFRESQAYRVAYSTVKSSRSKRRSNQCC